MIRSRRAALALLLAACGETTTPTPPPPPPPECGDGMRADGSGRCAFILPATDCAPHTHARVGLEACQPIGAGPCASPFVPRGDWTCAPPPIDCPARTTASLARAECAPVGWSTCAEGFAEEGGGCRPIRAASCSGATRPAIGSADCVPLGACGGSPPGDLFVDATTTPDATHFRTIAAALAAAAPGAVISIAAGEYAESLQITRPVQLHGTCAQSTRIRGGIAVSQAHDVVIHALTISGDRPGIRAQNGAVVSAEGVVIENSLGAGVVVEGSELSLENAVIRGVRAFNDGTFGRGIDVTDRGAAHVRDIAISGCREAGIIAVDDGTTIDLDTVIIDDVTRARGGMGGFGVAVAAGGRIRGTRVAIARVAEIGALAYLAPSAIDLDGVFIERTTLVGARAERGGALKLAHATLLDTTGAGVLVTNPTSTATITDAWIARVGRDPGSDFSAAMAAFLDATISADRVLTEDTSFGAIASEHGHVLARSSRFEGRPGSFGAMADGGSVRVSGSTMRGHVGGGAARNRGDLSVESSIVFGAEEDTGMPASGLTADHGALDVTGSAILGGIGFGILATGTTAVARVATTLVSGQRTTDRVIGQGISCGEATLDLADVRVDAVDGLGIIATGSISIARTTVTGITASRRQNGAALAIGGSARLTDVAVVDSQLAGAVFGEGQIDIDGLLVRATKPNDQGEFGHGLLGESTTLTARFVELRGNAAAGLAVDASTARITRSLIASNVVGAHAQGGSHLIEGEPSADPLAIVFGPDVVFTDNGTRVGVGTIPLPAPFDVLPR